LSYFHRIMNLNKIQLTPAEISRLYKYSLVEISAAINYPVKQEKEIAWKFLGKNNKHILIVLNYTDAVHLPDDELTFLTRLLAACNLNLGDIAILNIHYYPETGFENTISFFQPGIVFLFGVSPADFGMPLLFPAFQVQIHKNTRYLFAPSLEEIEADKNLKTKLWSCLKKIFNL